MLCGTHFLLIHSKLYFKFNIQFYEFNYIQKKRKTYMIIQKNKKQNKKKKEINELQKTNCKSFSFVKKIEISELLLKSR